MSKHRESIFVVVRTVNGTDHKFDTMCEAYRNLVSAEESAGRHKQHCKETGFTEFDFIVKPVTYYDE